MSLLPKPLGYRKTIPMYYPKTEAEIKADSYERYNPNVIRSARNFYDGQYGEVLLGKIRNYITYSEGMSMLELGCGSGYLIGNLAKEYLDSTCIGLDYSYQMLKMSSEVFKNVRESEIELKAFQNGMPDLKITTHNLHNLTYALSDACLTPLQDKCIDYCFSCFLFDRVGEPSKLIEEKIRVCKPGATIVIISPFNYLSSQGWNMWYPVEKIIEFLEDSGLELMDRDEFQLTEMLDIRGNRVLWEVELLALKVGD